MIQLLLYSRLGQGLRMSFGAVGASVLCLKFRVGAAKMKIPHRSIFKGSS